MNNQVNPSVHKEKKVLKGLWVFIDFQTTLHSLLRARLEHGTEDGRADSQYKLVTGELDTTTDNVDIREGSPFPSLRDIAA